MKVLIIFSTEVGTTAYVASLLQKFLVVQQHEAQLFEVKRGSTVPNLDGYDLILIGSPTYYGGQLEDKMSELLATFHPNLEKYKLAVFSLGDKSYQHFCGSAEHLEKWVNENKGTLIVPTLKIDGYPRNTQDISAWIERLVAAHV